MNHAPAASDNGLLSLAATKAARSPIGRPIYSPVKGASHQKPDAYPHKNKIFIGFAVILFFAWAQAHEVWPYGGSIMPAAIFFGFGSCLLLSMQIQIQDISCHFDQEDDPKFPHKWKIMFVFLVLFVLAWQNNHGESVDARI